MMESIATFYDELVIGQHWCSQGNQITYHGQETFRIKGGISNETVDYLRNEKMYSFELFDRSLVQLFYELKNDGTFARASLSFLKYEDTYKTLDYPPCIGLDVESGIEYDACPYLTEYYRNCWIRLDLSSNKFGVIHHDIHLHSSLLKNCRIPVSSLPTPHLFMETILVWFYSDYYKMIYLNETTGRLLKEYKNRIDYIQSATFNHRSHLDKIIMHLAV